MKKIQLIFLVCGLLICIVPFAGMLFYPTEETAENRRPAEYPSFTTKDGGLNLEYSKEFDAWFNDHFAFRNELVAADGYIQGKVFGTSAEEQVIYGTDGWLYYASTLEDYMGTGCMTERERFNLKNNLEILRDWGKEQGVELLLTVPPNKNTLYGEHMPYYDSMIVDPKHTLEYLPRICKEAGIPYADLYSMFLNEQETLYLKRDSHWNGKGALLAYNCIMQKAEEQMNGRDGSSDEQMDGLGASSDDQLNGRDGDAEEAGDSRKKWTYRDYLDAAATRGKDADGDLNRMLYSVYGEKEMDTHYTIPREYSYITATENVEDAWILTEAPGKTGKLVMFRDSFGNTLLPYVANQFGRACFTKESPYRLQKVAAEQKPDLVIFEKVERNLRDFITQPPIIAAPKCAEDHGMGSMKRGKMFEMTFQVEQSELEIKDSPYDPDLVQIFGQVPDGILEEDTRILLQVNGTVYRTFHIGEKGFMVYLDRSECPKDTEPLQVILQDD